MRKITRKPRSVWSLVVGLSLMAAIMIPVPVMAVDVLSPACQNNPESTVCKSNTDQPKSGNSIYGPNGVLTKAAGLFAVVVGIASVIMIIIGGFKYVMSSGDPSNIKSAKDTILYAIVGILVALLAQSIAVFILRKLV